MGERIEISPASVAQVHRSQKGYRVAVSEDVQNVARDLRDIRATLTLEYDPIEEFWVVGDTAPDGTEYLVTTSLTCDQRLVQRVREISQPSYDLVAEIDRVEAKAERERQHQFREQVGPVAEKLAWALRKDLGTV